MKFVLGLMIGAGIAFSFLAIWEKDEQKKLAEYVRYMERLNRLP